MAAAAVISISSSKVAALAALFVVLAMYAEAASPNGGWQAAKATWYGAPNGAGPDDNGGACGFKNTNQYPYMSMTSCGNQPLFKDGKGCGACYQIRCLNSTHDACSGRAKRVIITDMNYYPVSKYHFDLSGTAFGAMAKTGLNDKLRHAGILDIQFRRVPCNYKGLNVNFRVQVGSNPNYFAVLVQYAGKDGAVAQLDLMETDTATGKPTGVWTPMRVSWGAVWRLDTKRPLQPPFSLRVRNGSGKTLVASNVIPAYWKPLTDYPSSVQFP
ncbi:expansin-B6-like [Miscanthus floridulus]|uniref:expansin-B6-like n=1 Tax=Miscanthus floridulus TaxID=154761 RepID=UPI003458B561